MKHIRPQLQTASLRQYGKVRHLDGGDVMHASALVAVGDDHRDATFVRVSYILCNRICAPIMLTIPILLV
jgi:hypothetical protein